MPPVRTFDGVNEALGLAFLGDEHERAARGRAASQEALRDPILAPELVQQPPIQLEVLKSLLDAGHPGLGRQDRDVFVGHV